MNFTNKLAGFIVLALASAGQLLHAQTDLTSKITNPSFESASLTGWTWSGTSGYAWLGPNTDGDATKHGSYICGIWNAGIGDAECSQTITGLAEGYYRVGALATVSNNRLTNQRLVANASSQLYADASNTNYSASNLAILASAFGETSVSFAGNVLSGAENGPFRPMSVITRVTDGTLKIGFRVSGRSTTKGFVFTSVSSKSDEGFFKFDNFTLTEVSKVATLDEIKLSFGSLDTVFVAGKTIYTATLPAGVTSVKPTAVPTIPGVAVSGDESVDVSSGTGSSTLVVTSLDGTTSKTYTIQYRVLNQSYKKLADGVEMVVPNGSLKIKVCTDNIIQVNYTNASTIPAGDTVMVNKSWNPSPSFTVSDAGDTLRISTNALLVKISKTSFLISYYDLTGKLILAEASKIIRPVTVLSTKTNTCIASFFSPINEGLYGLGQHQQKIMNYKGRTEVLDQQNKEIALPFLLSTRGYGLLWDNYSYTSFNGGVASNTQYQFTSESGAKLDYYFMYGPQPDSVIHLYRETTGKVPMFPRWAYGLFQSKDKYSSATELITMVHKYREAGFPLDCIVQDWDYWTPDLWGSHTMNSSRYPDPKALVDSLHALNVHTMISIWPVFHKNTANFQAFNSINAVYPSTGSHHFYDPHNAQAKKIYWDQVNSQLFARYGWDAWWADNNEPQGYPDGLDRKSYTTAKGPGVTYYNTYPIEHTAGFYAGWRKDYPDKRVFTLSRSAFPGQQRYATAAWSGDIHSTWTDFQYQISAGLNFTMSGIPYWTTDIGGYFYVDWSTANNNELMTRWFQYGAFCPIFRIHGQGEKSMVSTTTLTPTTTSNMAKVSKLRYRLMPYIYSLAGKVSHENYTMMRHLVMDYPADVNVRNNDTQFMFGPALLVNPVTAAGLNKRNVYLPAGKWFDFWTGQQKDGAATIVADAPLDKIPLFVKAGSIIPMGPHINYASEAVDPIEVRVYGGANGSFTLYEDDGKSYQYEKGAYSKIAFTYDDQSSTLVIGVRKGSFDGMLQQRTFKVVLVGDYYGVGLESPVTVDSIVNYTGSEVVVKFKPDRILPVVHYEAENAALSGGAVVSATNKEFSGTGYVTGLNSSGKSAISFAVQAPETGLYKLVFRYAAGTAVRRINLKFEINRSYRYAQGLTATRDWNSWNTSSTIISLTKGSNTIDVLGDSSNVNLDFIELASYSGIPYQTQSGICRIKTYDGAGYLTLHNNKVVLMPKDSTLRTQLWKIEKVQSGVYKIGLPEGNSYLSSPGKVFSPVEPGGYTAIAGQQWKVQTAGDQLYTLASQSEGLWMGSVVENSTVQLTDTLSLSQFWQFEDTTVVQYKSVYESFDYPSGAQLNGLGTAGKGWGSEWKVFEGSASDFTIVSEAKFPDLTTRGNRLKVLPSINSAIRSYRDLYPRWEDDGQPIWISFLMGVMNPSSLANSWQGLSLYNGSAERVFIGKNWGKTVFGIVGYDASEGVSTFSALNFSPVWLVLKIKTSGDTNTEQVSMWINPATTTEPSAATASVNSTVQLNSGFDRIVCHLGNTSGITATYDEIRIGRSFELVSGSLNTSVIPLTDTPDLRVYYNQEMHSVCLITNASGAGNATVFLRDCNGRQLLHRRTELIPGETNEVAVPNGLAKGVYVVTIHTNEGLRSEKLIVH